MRYCLFEGGDVMGPFEAEQILLRPGFNPDCLVCPEDHSEEEEFWKSASFYSDFSRPVTPAPEQKRKPLPKDDSKRPQLAAIKKAASEFAEVVPEAHAVQAPKNVSQSQAESVPAESQPAQTKEISVKKEFSKHKRLSKNSPIEEYFNTIREGDLGNILGIPDAKENSDMDLARVIESQFEKTETDPMLQNAAKEETAKDLPQPEEEQTNPESVQLSATADAVEEEEEITLPTLPPDWQPQLSDAEEKEPGSVKPSLESEMPALPEETDAPENAASVSNTEDSPAVEETTASAVQEEPARDLMPSVTAQEDAGHTENLPAEPAVSAEDAASSSLSEEKQDSDWGQIFIWLTLMVLAVLLAVTFWWKLKQEQEQPLPTAELLPAVTVQMQPEESSKPAAPAVQKPAAPAAAPVVKETAAPVRDPLEEAKEIVQQYPLSEGRGTIEKFLLRRHAEELSSGYKAAWSAERLHQDVYVVKYRLAKTRKEPVVYIFQVNMAKKKLTAALNNITLDLVGKIN